MLWLTVALAGPVQAIFKDAQNFDPELFSEAMRRTEAIGKPAIPQLLTLLDDTNNEARAWALCEALYRVNYRAKVPHKALVSKLSHPKWLVRSACSATLGAAVEVPVPELSRLVSSDKSCEVRQSAASEMACGALCEAYSQWVNTEGCGRLTAIKGLRHCENGTTVLLNIAAHAKRITDREAALFTLRDMPPAPEMLAVARRIASTGYEGNEVAAAIGILGNVGSSKEIPLLKQVILDDPFGSGGFQAHEAKKAISRIQKRGGAAPKGEPAARVCRE